MNTLALDRLKASGWTPDRKVDFSSIRAAYENAEMEIPEKLQLFFSSYAFLVIKYEDEDHTMESHYIDPSVDFLNYNKKRL